MSDSREETKLEHLGPVKRSTRQKGSEWLLVPRNGEPSLCSREVPAHVIAVIRLSGQTDGGEEGGQGVLFT